MSGTIGGGAPAQKKQKTRKKIQGRLSFPKLFTPDDKGNYKCMLIVPKSSESDINTLKSLMMEAYVDRWPDKKQRIKSPIKDGDTDEMEDGTLRKEVYPELEGHFFINLNTKFQPKLVDAQVQPILDQADIYAGCWVNAMVHAYSYGPSKKKPESKSGVAFGFDTMQKYKEDTPFASGGGGSSANPEDDFDIFEDPAGNVTGGTNAQATQVSNDDMFM